MSLFRKRFAFMTATPVKQKGEAKTLYVRMVPPATRQFLHEYMDEVGVNTVSEAVRILINEAHIRHLKGQHGL